MPVWNRCHKNVVHQITVQTVVNSPESYTKFLLQDIRVKIVGFIDFDYFQSMLTFLQHYSVFALLSLSCHLWYPAFSQIKCLQQLICWVQWIVNFLIIPEIKHICLEWVVFFLFSVCCLSLNLIFTDSICLKNKVKGSKYYALNFPVI
jgi:hypothetical protein